MDVDRDVCPEDAAAASIPLITAALGDLCIFRGLGLTQRIGGEYGWHAGYKLPEQPTYSRIIFKADFHLG